MKKQKFQVYAQPVWKNIIVPSKRRNEPKFPIKNRNRPLQRASSLYKNPSDTKMKQQCHELPCIRLSDQEHEDPQFISKKDEIFQVQIPTNSFQTKTKDRHSRQNKSLRKVDESQEKFRNTIEPYQKRTVTAELKQRSLNKFYGSVTWSKKQFKELKLNRISGSPYINNYSDLSKIVRKLRPVKGPNQSIRKQIIQYNGLHKKNHELVVMRRQDQTFQVKMKIYLQRIGLQPTSKVFIINSRDIHIRQALFKKGWTQIQDTSAKFFHLKWVYSDNISDYSHLNHGQLFNHFHNNQQLTNKNNLRKNVKNAKIDNQPLIPLTFDLGIGAEYKKFLQISRFFEGIKILNLINIHIKVNQPELYQKISSISQNSKKYYTNKPQRFRKIIDNLEKQVQNSEYNQQTRVMIGNSIQLILFLANNLHKETQNNFIAFVKTKKSQTKKTIELVFQYFEKLLSKKQKLSELPTIIKIQFYKMKILIEQQKQTYFKSYGVQNSWIVKPTGVSRGTGIYIESDYFKLLSQENNSHGKIVQKYIEKPFLLSDSRKFDLRQWVLVRSFQPFEVYIYDKLYGRICPQKYVQKDFNNNQIHLTNYSLSKQFYKTKNSINTSTKDTQKSQLKLKNSKIKNTQTASIILQNDLTQQIKKRKAQVKKTWQEIKLQIKLNIIKTLRCCSGNIDQSENCFQVYGFDIMLDEDLNVFVIEVNLSPACQKRQGLEVYLDEMSLGLVSHIQRWINLDNNSIQPKQIQNDSYLKCWERLQQQPIRRRLRQINETKRFIQKAIIIQRWFRSYLKSNNKRSNKLNRINC